MSDKALTAKQTRESAQKRETAKPVAQKPVAQVQQADFRILQRAVANPRVARPSDILALQRTVGNQAVTRLIQTKLTVGAAGDRYEQEADHVAEQVMTMPASRSAPSSVQRAAEEEEEVQAKPLAAFITPLVQRQEAPEEEEVQTKPLPSTALRTSVQRQGAPEEEEVQTKPLPSTALRTSVQRQAAPEEEEVQTKPLPSTALRTSVQRQGAPEEEEVQTKSLVQRRGDGGFEAGQELESRLAAHKGGGSPLPTWVRASMEPRFGADFSGVRIHTGGEAAQLNRALSAQAFTHGQDIYLGAGAQAPGSEAGNRLLAHELTHTIQQGSSNRIARWGKPHGGTGHDVLTKEAFATLEPEIKRWYSDEAQEYLAGYSENIDIRAGFLGGSFLLGKMYQYLGYKPGTAIAQGARVTGRAIAKGAKAMGRGMSRAVNVMTGGKLGLSKRNKQVRELLDENKSYGQSEADKHRVADAYNDIKWYWRNPGEAANHGEAGKYRADGAAEDEARVNGYIKSAVAAWKGKDKNQALATLGLALHAAQDRGSHGDGKPGTGHDPRRVTPPPNEYARQDCYDGTDGFACDRKGENPEGWDFGVGFTQEVLSNFAYGIGLSGSKELTEKDLEVGAKLKGFEQPNKFKRFVRKTGTFFGKDIIKTR